jgi:hypothetical protein
VVLNWLTDRERMYHLKIKRWSKHFCEGRALAVRRLLFFNIFNVWPYSSACISVMQACFLARKLSNCRSARVRYIYARATCFQSLPPFVQGKSSKLTHIWNFQIFDWLETSFQLTIADKSALLTGYQHGKAFLLVMTSQGDSAHLKCFSYVWFSSHYM